MCADGACRWVLEELRRNLAKELDFRLEAGNAQRLAAAMAARRSVAVPKPVPEVGWARLLGCALPLATIK